MNRITKISILLWLACIVIVCAIIGYVVGIRGDTFDIAPDIYVSAFLIIILLGCLAFATGIISFTAQLIVQRSSKKPNIFTFPIKLFFALAFLPFYLFLYILGSSKKLFIKLVEIVLVILIALPIWIGGYFILGIIVKEALGYGTETISVSGTGSMYPTFPKGEGKDPKELAKQVVGTPGMTRYPNGLVIRGKRYINYQIGRGDIVVIENHKIRKMTEDTYGNPGGWVKRIIGMPGDSLEIREGIVYLNNEPLKEPYTAKARSTFGESFLSECKQVVVPDNSIFVMGDNRKGSGDSREIGFIEISAINHVLPLKDQAGVLDKGWRDTSKDFDDTSKIKLDTDKYLELLNQKRKEAGVKELKYQPKLAESATKRGEIILEYNDFSFEATLSGYTMAKAMRDANYSNTIWGEAPTQGYYEAEELIDNQFQFPETKKFLLNEKYQDVGIAEVEGEINGCPTQVITQHYAGYVPPNYNKEVVDSWKLSLSRLKEIQPNWAQLKDNQSYYQNNQADIDRINQIISLRISNLSTITARMEANQWLTAADQKMVDQDTSLYNEQETIATRLNSQH